MHAINISLPAFAPILSIIGTAGARRRPGTSVDWVT